MQQHPLLHRVKVTSKYTKPQKLLQPQPILSFFLEQFVNTKTREKLLDFARFRNFLSEINIEIILEFFRIESLEYKYNRREIKKLPISLNL